MTELSQKKCVPCEGGTPPLTQSAAEKLAKKLSLPWKISNNKELFYEFKFGRFKEAMAFTNKVADVAEIEGHHPDFDIRYNKVLIRLSTHAIGGLSENDFIMASKIEKISI